ncbi:hypothetical protein NDI54_03390 [Haloarcula sp. S1AR25-5A]|uniref:Uncharacterized protein n=1 Tax=Haloarcula terrestris TaxID=2950533 RepID=A0AAE4EUI7_9EURY|nr:hypothetical protein [Haloarcula terrestris]MDS0220391.1 hypothetical protein [Haloarcula terrestris]
MDLTRTEGRLLWTGMAIAGVLHLLIPGVLLSLAKVGYRWVLAVEFTPQKGARQRVRLLGVANLVVAAVLKRILG